MRIEQEDFATLCVCAIRYCQGRKTYMPSLVQGIVLEHLSDLSDKDLAVLLADAEFQEKFDLYGDEMIDKPGWLKWREKLQKEVEKRALESKPRSMPQAENSDWILCKDRPPKKDGEYLVTCKGIGGMKNYCRFALWGYEIRRKKKLKRWWYDDPEFGKCLLTNVIAWQPVEPYEEAGNE